jgi:hypothetical protein
MVLYELFIFALCYIYLSTEFDECLFDDEHNLPYSSFEITNVSRCIQCFWKRIVILLFMMTYVLHTLTIWSLLKPEN